MQHKTRLDVHRINSVNVGIYRAKFNQVVDLGGIKLVPDDRTGCVWQFSHPGSGERGRMLHVDGYLGDNSVVMSGKGMAYMITRQQFALALAFPNSPRTMWLTEGNHKILPKNDVGMFPPEWPREMIKSVIRLRLRKIVIIDESFLLRQIGLRTPDSPL